MFRVLLFAFLYLTGLVAVLGQEGCVWNSNTDVTQGLDPLSWHSGATYVAHLPEISDDRSCQRACCENEDCHLALVGTLINGTSECLLVNCMKEGKNVCVLRRSDTFRVYRKEQVSTPTPDIFDVRNANSTDRCRYSSAVGMCRAAFSRFFYNVVNQTCEQFIYGGCGGNANNFNSREECDAACTGVTGDVITDLEAPLKKPRMARLEDDEEVSSVDSLPEMTVEEFAEKCEAAPLTGLCRASMPRYYYDSGSCKRFKYGGCGGNQNNYLSEEVCMKACTVKIVEKKVDDSKEYQEACEAQPDTGTCRAAFQNFYFDSRTQSCQVFIYGGCKGNRNRYNTLDECMSKCAGKDGGFDEHGNDKMRSHWTPAIFLMATLTIVSIVLLVGMILITTRRAKQQQFFTLDDRQELLPEEQLPADDPPKPVLH